MCLQMRMYMLYKNICIYILTVVLTKKTHERKLHINYILFIYEGFYFCFFFGACIGRFYFFQSQNFKLMGMFF